MYPNCNQWIMRGTAARGKSSRPTRSGGPSETVRTNARSARLRFTTEPQWDYVLIPALPITHMRGGLTAISIIRRLEGRSCPAGPAHWEMKKPANLTCVSMLRRTGRFSCVSPKYRISEMLDSGHWRRGPYMSSPEAIQKISPSWNYVPV